MEPTTGTGGDHSSRARGCLLGGAIGDALGAPVEFRPLDRIRAEHGAAGVCGFSPDGTADTGLVTDDTQMTLFTVEGLVRAGARRERGTGFHPAGPVHQALLRWYDTQTRPAPDEPDNGWLHGEAWLYARRAPGMTCLSALDEARAAAARKAPLGRPARNNSKGCGGVMRSAPFGLLPTTTDGRDVFAWAAEAAGLTHGHPTGQLASGALALLVHRIVAGDDPDTALDTVLAELGRNDGHEETTHALERARVAAAREPATSETVETLGGGWIAEEALAIAVFAALTHPGPDALRDALALSVTHSGDSDSTGAICGNILGALHGEAVLPPDLAAAVEGRDTVLRLADDLVREFAGAGPAPGTG